MNTHRFALRWLGMAVALLLGAAPAYAQSGSITGIVMDRSTNEPVAGAEVTIVGTSTATLTQENGRFLLQNVAAGTHTLRVERLGFAAATREVTVSAGQTATVTVRLESEALALQEIIVTGVAGATQRAKVPFEVGQVNAEDLPVPQVSAASALQGKVAGVTVVSGQGRPGTAPSILLRGPTSINASGRDQEPLYIVDGVILGSSMVDIDALDIESIEVVKGAAAASLYGSRAANGVIQIITKRGRNMADDVVRYTIRSEYGQSNLPRTPEALLTEKHQYQVTADGLFINEGSGTTCDWLLCASPTLAGTDAWDTYQIHAWPGQTFNQVERFFETGQFMQNYVAAEGRSGSTNFHVSMSNLQDGGVMPGQDGFDRTNFRINVDQAVVDGFQVSGSAFYSRGEADRTPGGMFDLTRQPAGVDLLGGEPIDLDGDGKIDEFDNSQLVLVTDPTNVESPNPIYQMLTQETNEDRSRFLGSANLRYAVTEWLDVDANMSYDRLDYENQNLYPKGFRTPQSSSLNDGFLERETSVAEALNTSLTATARFQLTPDIANQTQLRYLYESQDNEWIETNGREFAVANVPVFANVNPDRIAARSSISAVRSDGYFAITNFDIMDRYIVDALVRNDGSSLFGEDERRQWYYRIAGAWRMAQEPWFAVDAVDELKLRYSLGTAGGRPRFEAQYETYSVSGGRVTPVNLGNTNLKPEFSTEQEIGVDAAFMEGRYILGLTYANAVTEDQILPVPLPAYSGFRTQWRNAGTLESNTYEASFQARLLRTDNVDWSARLIYDRTRSTISELSVPPFTYGVPGQGLGTVFYAREGEELGTFYGVHYATGCENLPDGVDCSQFAVNDDDFLVWVGEGGSLSEPNWGATSDPMAGKSYQWGTVFAGECTDRSTGEQTLFCPVGNSMPDFNMGFSSTLTWKGLSLYGLLDAAQGFDVYNQPLQWGTFKRYSGIMDQSDVPENQRKPVGYFDALYGVSGLQPSNAFVEDGSFVKLREMSLAYRFGASALSGIPGFERFNSVGLSLTGRNLYTWTDYRGYDPEVGSTGGVTGSAAIARVEGYGYPNFRTWTAALELVF